MKKQIAIIDYGMGNLHSVASALNYLDESLDIKITANAEIVRNADHVVFPGVGAIRDCMAEILRLGVDKAVAETIAAEKPLLAICVGMQALMQSSDENNGIACLGHFPGEVKFFSENEAFTQAQQNSPQTFMKVPHMGWNNVAQKLDHPLWQNIDNEARFYFVHSYFVAPKDASLISGSVHYGLEFAAALAHKNVFACQFHPEKSHNNGLQLLKNFLAWNGTW